MLPSCPRAPKSPCGCFGHKEGKSKQESCQSSETVYPLAAYEESSFSSALNRFDAEGWTPLAKAIRDAKSDLAQMSGEGVQNIVYIVSDGEETCGGDPVKEARALHTSEMKAIINIIGFDVSNAEQRALKEVAKAGGGSYKSARSAKDLEEQLYKEREQLQEELLEWSNLTLDDINKRHDKLLNEKDHIADKLYALERTEGGRLSDAQNYLSKIHDIWPAGLDEKLHIRSSKIHDYIGYLNSSTSNKIGQKYSEAIDRLQEKKDSVDLP